MRASGVEDRKRRVSAALLLGALALACATAPAKLTEAGAEVEIGKGDPTEHMAELGPIEAFDGAPCNRIGKKGTYKQALTNLKNKAARMQADYVQIYTMTEPSTDECGRFIIRGVAFKREASAESAE